MRITVRALLDGMRRLAALVLLLPLLGTARGQGDAPSGDGRAAAVADLQGRALVRPAGRDRWSPLAPRAVLLPGDVVRTPARGANAVELRLAKGGALVLGPGALVQVAGASEVRML